MAGAVIFRSVFMESASMGLTDSAAISFFDGLWATAFLIAGAVDFFLIPAVLLFEILSFFDPGLLVSKSFLLKSLGWASFDETTGSLFFIGGEIFSGFLFSAISFSRFSTKGSLWKSDIITLRKKTVPFPQDDESRRFMLVYVPSKNSASPIFDYCIKQVIAQASPLMDLTSTSFNSRNTTFLVLPLTVPSASALP